jgi:hypothetical protein
MPKQSKSQATIVATDDGQFAVVLDGEIIRSGFKTRGHGAMWATRQGIYQGTTARRPEKQIPPALEDESIKRIPLLARMSGKSYPRFLAEVKAGMYGPVFQLGRNALGLKFGNWKRGMAARIVK